MWKQLRVYLHKNGRPIAEVQGLNFIGDRKLAFRCPPPLIEADDEYEIHPVGERPIKIIISSVIFDGAMNHISAFEL